MEADNEHNEIGNDDLSLYDTNSNSVNLDVGNHSRSNIADIPGWIMQIYYYSDEEGSYISDEEKFWIKFHLLDDNDAFDKYMLIDIVGNIYKMMPANDDGDEVPIDFLLSVSNDVILLGRGDDYRIFDITDSSENHIGFNEITSQYLADGEKIWSVHHDDSGWNIFTVSLVDTYSYQDMTFNVYDGNMNLKFSFSKSGLFEKYDFWGWKSNNLNLEFLGGCIYGINSGSHKALYIDTDRQKAFISETVFTNMYFDWSSNGNYILCTGGYSDDDYLLIDIISESVIYHDTVEIALSDIGISSNLYHDASLTDFSNVSEKYCYAYTYYGTTKYYVLLQFENVAINSILVYPGSKVTNFSEFHNDMSILELENSGGTKFITMLHSDGEWQFEPISGSIENGVYYLDGVEKFLVISDNLESAYLIGTGGLEQEINRITINDTFFHIIDHNGKYQIVCLDNLSNSLKYIDI